tara:strand:+ start:374 stop:508 length:135 start_codon:yes stop_codon:yes gene_type:complete
VLSDSTVFKCKNSRKDLKEIRFEPACDILPKIQALNSNNLNNNS